MLLNIKILKNHMRHILVEQIAWTNSGGRQVGQGRRTGTCRTLVDQIGRMQVDSCCFPVADVADHGNHHQHHCRRIHHYHLIIITPEAAVDSIVGTSKMSWRFPGPCK